MIAAQEADPLLDDLQHAAAKDVTLLLRLRPQQPEHQVLLLEAAVAGDVLGASHLAQLSKGQRLEFDDIHGRYSISWYIRTGAMPSAAARGVRAEPHRELGMLEEPSQLGQSTNECVCRLRTRGARPRRCSVGA